MDYSCKFSVVPSYVMLFVCAAWVNMHRQMSRDIALKAS